jgi:hypothetical protein
MRYYLSFSCSTPDKIGTYHPNDLCSRVLNFLLLIELLLVFFLIHWHDHDYKRLLSMAMQLEKGRSLHRK